MKTLIVLFLGICLGFTVAQFVPNSIAAVNVKITGEGDMAK